MQRRVGIINCHVSVKGNARQVGHVARGGELDVCGYGDMSEEQVDMVRSCATRADMTGSAKRRVCAGRS